MRKLVQNNTLKLVRGIDSENATIEGYAAVFNYESKPITERGKTFIETIDPHAFDEVLREETDVILTIGHDKNKLIARTKSGTLSLSVDEKGLKFVAEVPNTTLGRDIAEQVERGDLFECSFIAEVPESAVKYSRENGVLKRHIEKAVRLHDVSIVTHGAYASTDVVKRELEDIEKNVIEIEREEKNNTNTQQKKPEKEVKTDDPEKDPKKEEKPEGKSTEVKREIKVNNTNNNKSMNIFEIIRSQLLGKENPGNIYVSRSAENGTSDYTSITPSKIGELDILGKKPIWKELGVTPYPDIVGTQTLPYEDPIVAEKVAQLVALTKNTITPSGNLLTPKRFGVTKEFNLETLVSGNESAFAKIMADMVIGCDRKITSEVMALCIAGGTEITGITKTKAGLDAMAAAPDIENDGTFLSSKKIFTSLKAVPLDAGSGRFLVSKTNNSTGETYEGDTYRYSPLFADNYLVYGDMSKIAVGTWNTELEIIIDPYTRKREGVVEITVNKLADVQLTNPFGICKSTDLSV